MCSNLTNLVSLSPIGRMAVLTASQIVDACHVEHTIRLRHASAPSSEHRNLTKNMARERSKNNKDNRQHEVGVFPQHEGFSGQETSSR